MELRNLVCQNCGHICTNENPFFSEDFAIYYSPKVGLMWCYDCTHVSIYTQRQFLKIVKLPGLKLYKCMSTENVDSEVSWKMKDPKLGFFAGAHLMRMVWNCLKVRVDLEEGENANQEKVVHLALDKLPPYLVAIMIFMTIHSTKIVPLERQIYEGNYIQDYYLEYNFLNYLSTSPRKEAAQLTLEVFKSFKED